MKNNKYFTHTVLILNLCVSITNSIMIHNLYHVDQIKNKEESTEEIESTIESEVSLNTIPSRNYITLSLEDIINSYGLQFFTIDHFQLYKLPDYNISVIDDEYRIFNDENTMIITSISLQEIDLERFDTIFILDQELIYVDHNIVYKYNSNNNSFIKIEIYCDDEYMIDYLIAMGLTIRLS